MEYTEINDTFEQLNQSDSCSSIECEFAELKANLDSIYQILCALIIFFMQCGFAFLECGSVRAKNSTNIIIKNLLDSFVAGLAYWSIGYPLSFGDGNSFVGYSNWFMSDLADGKFSKWFFHFVYAATASTIVSGAMAERCDFVAYLAYSFLLTGFVYPVVSHWAWSDFGWLKVGSVCQLSDSVQVNIGYQDFAGSGVVHLVGGVAALIGCKLLGPRIGRFDEEDETPHEIKGHSVPLAALGGFILIFGFFAITAGKQGSMSNPGDGAAIARSAVNTVLSASCAAFTTLLLNKTRCFGNGRWSLLMTLNGSLTGMVSICAGANAFYSWAAAVTGTVAALFYMIWIWIIIRLHIDDPLDVVAVHGGGGIWGVLSVPLFHKRHGIFFTTDCRALLSLAWNFCGLLAIISWTAIICLIMFGILKKIKHLRVPADIEVKGLDIPKHGEPAYPSEAYEHGWGEKGDALKNMVQMSTRTAMPVPDMKPRGTVILLRGALQNHHSPRVPSGTPQTVRI